MDDRIVWRDNPRGSGANAWRGLVCVGSVWPYMGGWIAMGADGMTRRTSTAEGAKRWIHRQLNPSPRVTP